MKRIIAVLISVLMLIGSFPICALADGQVIIPVDMSDGLSFNPRYRDESIDNAVYYYKVPEGTYYVSQLRLFSNSIVDFTGCTLIKNSSEGTMIRLGAKSEWDEANGGAGYPGYSGYSNITIIGGTFDGGGFKQAIMRFGHSSDITIRDATFRNVYNTHMIEVGACKNIHIENCTFYGFKGNWTSTTNYETVQFEITAGGHFSAYKPDNDETPCRDCSVTGCTFRDLQRGIGTHTAVVNNYFDNMVFENNYFENITGYAISALNYTNSRINGNTIANCGSGIIFGTMQKARSNFYAARTGSNSRSSYIYTNSQINGNNIYVKPGYHGKYKNMPYGIQIYGEKLSKSKNGIPKGDYRCGGVTVSGNTIHLSGTEYGIWLLNSVKNTVSYNSVSNAKGHGIYLDKGIGNKFIGNAVNNSKRSGIALYGAKKSYVIGNKISKSKDYGIFITNSKKVALKKVSGNKITKSGKKAKNFK